MSNEELVKYYSVLQIEGDVESITYRDATIAFRKIALKIHPDKAGPESKEAFQELLHAYARVHDHFKAKNDISNDDERFFRDNFEKFNFPFENKGSFTVSIEDSLADTWQNCIETIHGDPKIVLNGWGTECDRIWKVQHGDDIKIDITIHIYNNPKNKKGSKLMLQGSIQSLICSFVFQELPKVYKLVCENQPRALEDKPRLKKKTPAKPTVKCDQCKFKSTMIQMKMHIQNVHTKPRRASKRLPAFTPCANLQKEAKLTLPSNSVTPLTVKALWRIIQSFWLMTVTIMMLK